MPVTPNNYLVTIHSFKEQEYLIRFELSTENFQLRLSDKQTEEEWHCDCDHEYIERLTSKTGNFKAFDVFTKMLNSGLLKSSRSITLNLLTNEEVHHLQTSSKMRSYLNNNNNDNRRYLILMYITEFDKTYYPLTLEYSGAPDVKSLIATIRRMETDLTKTREEFAAYKVHHNSSKYKHIDEMQKKINELTLENEKLSAQLHPKSKTKVATKTELAKTSSLENALIKLEKSVIAERNNHEKYVNKLQLEKKKMQHEIETLRRSENVLKQRLAQSKKSSGVSSLTDKQSLGTISKSFPSRQPSNSNKYSSSVTNQRKFINRTPSKCSRTSSGCESIKSRSSSASRFQALQRSSSQTSQSSSIARSQKIKMKLQSSQHDYKALENRINGLQKKLLSNQNR